MIMIRLNHYESILSNRLASTLMAALAAILLAAPAGANDLLECEDGAYFSGHAYLCDYVVGASEVLEGKPVLTKITGAQEFWWLETDYDCTTGLETLTWDMLLNEAGKGELWGEAVLEPATAEPDSTFTESIYVKGGKTVKSGSYTGTGDFEGYVIDYQITRSKYVPTVSPCDDQDPPLHILDFSGYVYITE
jgi:hypothetical protein